MPTTTTPQAESLRAELALLTAKAAADLRELVSFDAAEAARDALMALLPRLVDIYGSASASLTADWYDMVRSDAGVSGRFSAFVPEAPDTFGTDELARWGVGPLFDAEPNPDAARVLIEGGMQRRIVNQSRAVLTESAIADPAAAGWQRVGRGGCTSGFCDMLIARGDVYTEATAAFAAHDHCQCSAVPAWGGEPVPVKPYTPSTRNITDADRARLREYLRNTP